MKILSITAQKPDSTGSGVYLTELVKGFQKLGHTQAVICGITAEDDVQMPEGVSVFPVYYKSQQLPFPVAGMSDEMPYESTRYSDMTDEMTLQFRKTFGAQIQSVVDSFRPDLILCHHLYYLTALVRELCPERKVFGICHGSDLRQMQKNPWQGAYVKQGICGLDQIFALHQEQKEDICRYYECAKSQVEVIGTGYNSSVFYISQEQKKKDEKTRLIFAGKISEKKGVMSLLRALSYLPNAKEKFSLALAGGYGNAEEYAKIEELAKSCPCEVEFLGKLSQNDLASALNQSDIFVLPSFFEGLPLVVIEAMACGLSVVCTDLPGIQPWLAANIPDNGVIFVKPPEMKNADEPVKEALPEFEESLADAILLAVKGGLPKQEDVKKLAWEELCRRLVAVFLALS